MMGEFIWLLGRVKVRPIRIRDTILSSNSNEATTLFTRRNFFK